MSASTDTDTKTRPRSSKTASASDEIIELQPPAAFGFSGTAKFQAVEQAALIEELLKRGYTKADRDRG